MELDGAPFGETIWIEPGNGDNAPLALEKFHAAVPVVRMLFQAPSAGGVDLLYGNARAAAPRYDLSLVAPQVLAAAAVTATLADGDPTVPAAPQMTRMAPVLFYVVLGLVVAGLILVILRLAPRPEG